MGKVGGGRGVLFFPSVRDFLLVGGVRGGSPSKNVGGGVSMVAAKNQLQAEV